MPFVRSGDYEIYYETQGDLSVSPLLLINGFTAQCVAWPPGFVAALIASGFSLIRFDNRDVGLTTKSVQGQNYLLADMASDAVAVLDAVGVDKALVWGQSMGGMIAQTLAFSYPDRCAALCSVMSTTGQAGVGGASEAAIEALMTPNPPDRDGHIAGFVRSGRVFAGPSPDDEWEASKGAMQFDRCYWPQGSAHQMSAIMKSGSRVEQLGTITCPVTVIHGAADPLIELSGGEATAAAIPGSKLVVLELMGHTLPALYWPTYAAEMVELRDRVQ